MVASHSLAWTVVLVMTSFPLRMRTIAGTPEGMVSLSCMYGFGISGLNSEYDSTKRDRQWERTCSRIGVGGGDNCSWTYDYVNTFGQKNFNFDCIDDMDDGYISGLYSEYDTQSSDRRWRIECCQSPGVDLASCANTNWVNAYKKDVNFPVPTGKVLAGISSQFGYKHGDRRWRFRLCDRITTTN